MTLVILVEETNTKPNHETNLNTKIHACYHYYIIIQI